MNRSVKKVVAHRKHGFSLLGNTCDVLNGSGYHVDVMILHYYLTFYNELTNECKCVARVTLKKSNEEALLLAETVQDIFRVFNYDPEKS